VVRSSHEGVFKTRKRIRLGIWGLGRGMNFYHMCRALNFDVVAGCDYNERMRARFQEANPGAMTTASAEEFLDGDFDAVLLATYCTAHADDAIACLRAGKHVLSEVTSFHTMAEGVRLVEAVERSGRVYNLAENYPFSAPQMCLAELWRKGVMGELMYAEGEYVHDVRELSYMYVDGMPIEPGWTLHHWRSWLNFHYYCTHSLGPIMVATGTRPTRVVALPGVQNLFGNPVPDVHGLGVIAPSLINMDNGSIVRNLMGGTTNDVHMFRYWGTKGAAEVDHRLVLRLGGRGLSPKLEVKTDWGELSELAAKTGHGGGDFWVMYYFARQILFGTPAPFEIYSAADVTIPGILAYRSSEEGGKPFDVPNWRNKREREPYRNDHYAQPRFDPKTACFPKKADPALVGEFTGIMTKLLAHAANYRAYADWMPLAGEVTEPARLVGIADAVIKGYREMKAVYGKARRLAEAYPRSEGARLLREVLEVGGEKVAMKSGFLETAKRERAKLARRAASRPKQ